MKDFEHHYKQNTCQNRENNLLPIHRFANSPIRQLTNSSIWFFILFSYTYMYDNYSIISEYYQRTQNLL